MRDSMLADEKSWAIRYLVINTSNWWLGHEGLVAPEWITEVNWAQCTVMIDLSRQAIKESPHWDPTLLRDRPQEAKVYQHYGRKGYWDHETLASLPPRHGAEHARAHRQHLLSTFAFQHPVAGTAIGCWKRQRPADWRASLVWLGD